MAAKEPENYYLRWIVHTFRGPWGIASLVGSILALVVPIALRYIPTLSSRTASLNDLLWQVPLGMLVVLAGIRFLTVPRELHLEATKRATDAERQLQQAISQQRPTVVVTRFEELVEDDPRSNGPYTNEYLRFTNVGPETALTISIDPVLLGGHDLTLWEPIDLIKPGEQEERMPRGGLWSGLKRARKAAAVEYVDEIRIPLLVKYSDRHGNSWQTPHAIISRGNDVRLEPIRSLSDVKWTDLASS